MRLKRRYPGMIFTETWASWVNAPVLWARQAESNRKLDAAPVSILSVEIVTVIYVNLTRKVCTLDSNLNQEVAHS